jgi:hypothetical protein
LPNWRFKQDSAEKNSEPLQSSSRKKEEPLSISPQKPSKAENSVICQFDPPIEESSASIDLSNPINIKDALQNVRVQNPNFHNAAISSNIVTQKVQEKGALNEAIEHTPKQENIFNTPGRSIQMTKSTSRERKCLLSGEQEEEDEE